MALPLTIPPLAQAGLRDLPQEPPPEPPLLPHTSRGRMVAPAQFAILHAVALANKRNRWPTRYAIAKARPGRFGYSYRAIEHLIDIGLLRLFGRHDHYPLLAVTRAGFAEIEYWAQTKRGQS